MSSIILKYLFPTHGPLLQERKNISIVLVHSSVKIHEICKHIDFVSYLLFDFIISAFVAVQETRSIEDINWHFFNIISLERIIVKQTMFTSDNLSWVIVIYKKDFMISNKLVLTS